MTQLKPVYLRPFLQAIEFGQYEEAFEIYKKFGKKVEAVQVLLTHCKDLDRAHDYANKVRRAIPAATQDRYAVKARAWVAISLHVCIQCGPLAYGIV
jgi:hypothetical protein